MNGPIEFIDKTIRDNAPESVKPTASIVQLLAAIIGKNVKHRTLETLEDADLSIGRMMQAKPSVKGSEIAHAAAGIGEALVSTLGDMIRKKGAEAFNDLTELKEDGVDLIHIISVTKGLTAAIIGYSRDCIKEEGLLSFIRGLPGEVQGVRDLANRGWDGMPKNTPLDK
ncbi:hypothetical protein ACFL3T_01755 [Patescibacteria group bacterium]